MQGLSSVDTINNVQELKQTKLLTGTTAVMYIQYQVSGVITPAISE